MDGNEAASDLLAHLLTMIEAAVAGAVVDLPTANIALAMRYVEASYELDRLEQRAVSCCAYLQEGLSSIWPSGRIDRARSCAADAVETLREQLAQAPLTPLAASLSGF